MSKNLLFCRKTVAGWILFVVFLAIASSIVSAEGQKYAVTQTFTLQQKLNGRDGTLQLLMDVRLTGSVRDELWGKGGWSFVFSPDSKMYKKFSVLPPAKSKLRIRDSSGKLVAERGLETPLAKLEAWNPSSGNSKLFLLTEDYSVGAGSYNGLGTVLLQVANNAFHYLGAMNPESHQEEPIRLVKSLKSDWRITMRENVGEILSVSCRPKNDGSSVINYVRYSFDGTNWLAYRREMEGLWESDEPFPSRSAFP